MNLTVLMILLPFITAPVLAYMFNKTFSSNKINKKVNFKKIKVKDIDVIDNIIVIKDTEGYYGVKFFELDTSMFDNFENDLEAVSRLSKLGRIIANINAEVEYRLVKFDIGTDKLSKKIIEELDRLKLIKESKEIILKDLEEREKELKKIYEYIINGEKLSLISAFIVIRKKNKSIQGLVSDINSLSKELTNAIKITLGGKAVELKKDIINNLIETKLLVNPVPHQPRIIGESNLGKNIPYLVENSFLKDYNHGIFIGYIRNSKKPFIVNFERYANGHFLIVGPTGKGKTTLISVIVKRLYARGSENFIVIDPKGDMNNLLPSSIRRSRISSVTKVHLKHFIEYTKFRTSRKDNPFISSEELANKFVREKSLQDNTLISINELEELIGERIIYVDLDDNIVEKIALELFDDKKCLITMDNLTDSGREIISFLLLKTMQDFMYSRGPQSRAKKWLFIDEAWRLSEASIYYTKRLIKEARGFGITLVLSTQTIQDLPNDLLHNFSNIIIFGSSDVNYVKSVSQLIGYPESSFQKTLLQLGTGQALFKLMNSKPVIVDIMA